MALLNNYAAVTRFDSNGILITDGSSGTRKITAANAALDLAGMVSAVQHRNIFGGRNLGGTITDAQKAAISSGTFDNLYIGDYWTISNVKWVIADMDYYYDIGDTNFTRHHLVIIPSAGLYNHVMNDTNTTEGGYIGSKMYTEGLEVAKSKINNAFGNMVLTHRDYFINAVTNGYPSAGAWLDSTVELMNDVQIYGCRHWSSLNSSSISAVKYTAGKQQFALFRLNPRAINNRGYFWLRDVISSAAFAYADGRGLAHYSNASSSYGVRPYAIIG